MTALALILPGTAAHAFEVNEFGTRLKAFSQEQGTPLNWTELSGDQAQLTARGLTMNPTGGADPVQLGDVTFSDIKEEGDHYRIGAITAPNYTFAEKHLTVTVQELAVSGAQLPFEVNPDNAVGLMLYDSAMAESVTVVDGGKQVLTASDLTSTLRKTETGRDFSLSAGQFTGDLMAVSNANTQATLSALGYETISGKMTTNASWNTTDGHLVAENTVDVNDAGRLKFTFDLSGYTPAFMKTMRETTEKMAQAPQDQQSAQSMAMLGLMQQLTFNGMTIRFEDASLTEKALQTIAQKQNTTPDAIVNQAKAILPFGLAQLNMPDFASSVSSAVNSFLDNPQSIQITAKPAAPLPFAQMAAMAMMARGPDAPKAIINQLGISVSAND